MTEIKTVAVLGGGLMGSGIAQVCAAAGYTTIVREISDELTAKARAAVSRSFDKSIEKGKATADDKDRALSLLRFTTSMSDLANANVVIEAVVESLDVKRALFAELDAICAPATIFASNTSSLTIAEIAAGTKRADRFVGMHFFNPVPAMKLVEVVRAIQTSQETVERATAFVRTLGKEPVAAHDNSGFIVNLLLVPYMIDAIRALESRRRHGRGHRQGDDARRGSPHGTVHASRLRRARHDLQDRRDHVRRVSRAALCAAAAAQANGHCRHVRQEIGTWLLRLLDQPARTERARLLVQATTRPENFRGTWRDDDEACAVYSESAGIARITPRAVAVPADADDVVALVRWAHDRGVAIIPRGSGSSMCAGSIGDGVIVDLSRMRALGDVDAAGKRVHAECGVVLADVQKAAAAHSLRFPPDPSSSPFCSVGGIVSTNAAGAHTLKYGATRAWVACARLRLRRRLARDDRARQAGAGGYSRARAIRRRSRTTMREREASSPSVHPDVRKDSSGYALHAWSESGELVDLLVGSEGTLCIVARRDAHARRRTRCDRVAARRVPNSRRRRRCRACARATPALRACELLDRTFLDVARAGSTVAVADGVEAVLLAEVEGRDDAEASRAADSLAAAFRTCDATDVRMATADEDENRLWELRHAASPILATLGPSLTSMQFIEDGAVPPPRLPEYVRGIRAILDGHGVRGVIFGHAGDSHVHVNPLIDVSRIGWRGTVSEILTEAVALTARLGGTLDAEHGDGRLRTPLLHRVWGAEVLRRFEDVKRAFDPHGIFNPGVKVALQGERAITEIKYDPDAAAASAARGARRSRASRRTARMHRSASTCSRGPRNLTGHLSPAASCSIPSHASQSSRALSSPSPRIFP